MMFLARLKILDSFTSVLYSAHEDQIGSVNIRLSGIPLGVVKNLLKDLSYTWKAKHYFLRSFYRQYMSRQNLIKLEISDDSTYLLDVWSVAYMIVECKRRAAFRIIRSEGVFVSCRQTQEIRVSIVIRVIEAKEKRNIVGNLKSWDFLPVTFAKSIHFLWRIKMHEPWQQFQQRRANSALKYLRT